MLAATALVLALPAHAAPAKRPATTCTSLPEPVRAYLRSDPQWKVVDIGDLDREDQQSWLENSGHACPGLAVVKLDGSGKTSYGVAQLRRQGSKFQEKIVVLQATDKDYRRVTLLEPFGDAPVHVIWRADPGRFKDFYTGRRAIVRYDGIGIEQISANTFIHYLVGGKFKTVQTSG